MNLSYHNLMFSCFSLQFPQVGDRPFLVVPYPTRTMATMPCVGASLAVRPNGIMVSLARGRRVDEEMLGYQAVGVILSWD